MPFAAAIGLDDPFPARLLDRLRRQGDGRCGAFVTEPTSDAMFVGWDDAGLPVSWVHRSDVAVICEARLDNADDLRRQLNLPGTASSAMVVAATYLRWGEEGPVRLRGEFGAVVWDHRRRTVHLVSDHIAGRPLYRTNHPGRLVVCTEVAVLVDEGFASRDLDDVALARFATSTPRDDERTFFGGVSRVPSASIVSVTAERAQQRRYWRLDEVTPLRLRSYDDCVAGFVEVLSRAVERRLGPGTTAAHLSGGLDSTVIAAVAADHLRKRGGRLTTYSLTSNPALAGDRPTELPWIRAALDWLGDVDAHVFVDDSPLAPPEQDLVGRPVSMPCGPGEPWIRRSAITHGVGTVLSGWGGDEVVSAIVSPRDLVRHHQWSAILGEVRTGGLGAAHEVRRALRPQSSQRPPRTGIELAEAHRDRTERRLVDLGTAPEFARLMLATALERPTALPGDRLAVRWQAQLQRGHLQFRIDEWAEADARHGLHTAYPLLDRDLLEFVVGVPPRYLRRGGRTRTLLRDALAALGDPRVHRRQDKTGPVSNHHERRLAAVPTYERTGALVADSPAVHRYVDPERLAGSFKQLVEDAGRTGGGFDADLAALALVPASNRLLSLAVFVALSDRSAHMGVRSCTAPAATEPVTNNPGGC